MLSKVKCVPRGQFKVKKDKRMSLKSLSQLSISTQSNVCIPKEEKVLRLFKIVLLKLVGLKEHVAFYCEKVVFIGGRPKARFVLDLTNRIII